MKKVYRLTPESNLVERMYGWDTECFEEDEVWLASSGCYYTIAIDELTAWMKVKKYLEEHPQ